MDLESLSKVSDGLVDKLLKGALGVSSFFKDAYKFNLAKENYLDKISQLQYVRTLNDFEESVSLYEFYVPPHLANAKEKKVFQVRNLEDIKAHRKILISGIVGQGKSVLMRHLAISQVLEHNKIPLFYELRYLQKGQNLEHVLKQLFSEWLNIKSQKLIEYVLLTGQVTLFFDGFDEIHIDDMPKIVLGLEGLLRKYPNLNFVVSSRPENVIDSSTIFQNFQIQKLDFNAQKNIVNALLKDKKMQVAVISGIESSNIEVKDALITPLMVNLFVFIYKHEKIIPEHVKDFYDRLFDLVLRKHDNTKIDFKRDRATKLDNKSLRKILQLISYMCCKQQVFAFDESVFRRLVERAIQINKLECSVDDLIYDLTGVLCFIVREGYLFAFIHKSIPEYFAAEFIRDKGEPEKLYHEIYIKYDQYEKVAEFLRVIDEYNYNHFLLNRIYEESLSSIRSKDFLDCTYVSFVKEVPELRIIFKDYVHDYLSNYLRNNTSRHLIVDIKKNYSNIKRFSVSVISKAKNEEYEIAEQEGVFKDYFSSVSDNNIKGRIDGNALEKHLQEFSFKKIRSANMAGKFSNTLIFLNSFISDVEKNYVEIHKVLNIHQVDDYSF